MAGGRVLLAHLQLLRRTLAGYTGSTTSTSAQTNVHITTFHTSILSSDDILRSEESPSDQASLSVEERAVVRHFESNHTRSKEERFIVPLPKDPNARSIGESRSQAVKRFLSLERSLNSKGCFQEFNTVMQEYLDLGHAEAVPTPDLEKLPKLSFYLPMHAVYKTSSTTTKIRAVFDASAESSTGVSMTPSLLGRPHIPRWWTYCYVSDCILWRSQLMSLRCIERSN